MREPSKAERYKQVYEAMQESLPKGVTLSNGDSLRLGTTGESVWIGVHQRSLADALTILRWFRDTFEPPKDAVAEIIKGLRVEEMPEVGELTEEEKANIWRVWSGNNLLDIAYRAGAEAMWGKVRRA